MNETKLHILLTGSTGFIGQHLLKELSEVVRFSVLSRQHSDGPEVYSWENLDQLPQVDWCIHLAGLAHDLREERKDGAYMEVNYGLTKKLFDALRGKCTNFLFFSSIKAICDQHGINLKETAPYHPSSAYGKSKQKAEEYILSKADPYEIQTYVFRPVMIYGEGSKGNVNNLISLIRKGLPYPFSAYQNEKSVLYIGNLLFAVEHFIEHPPAPGIYHISDEEKLSSLELAEHIGKALGKDLRKIGLPSAIYRKIVLSQKNGKLYQVLRKLLGDLSVDNSKLLDALENARLPYTTEDGFKSFLSS